MIDKNKDKDTDTDTEIKVKESEKLIDSKKKSSEDKTSDVNDINAKPLNDEKAKKNILKKGITDKNENKVISTDSKKNANGKNDVDLKTSQKKHPKSNSNNKQTKSSSNQNEENEYIEKLVSINRVAKVVKGGRRFSFAALVVVGDGNGLVGHGKGKAKEVPEAIKKATDEAKINMIRVPLRQARTLHHDITGRFDSGKVYLRSAPSGTGVIAGGPMRAVFEALGVKDIVAKSVGSSNPHNMIRATFQALSSASSPKLISIRRGLKVNEITKRRKSSSSLIEGASDG